MLINTLINAGDVACGRDLGRGQIFLIFLFLADHMPAAFKPKIPQTICCYFRKVSLVESKKHIVPNSQVVTISWRALEA